MMKAIALEKKSNPYCARIGPDTIVKVSEEGLRRRRLKAIHNSSQKAAVNKGKTFKKVAA